MSAEAPRSAGRLQRLSLAAALVVLCITASPPAAAESISVVSPGLEPSQLPAPLVALLGDRARVQAATATTGELFSRAEVILLTPASVEWIEKADAETLAAITRKVSSGKGLVVWGIAAGARPTSPAYAELLGRESPAPSPLATPPAAAASPASLAILVRDQSHPITQCVTHLALDGAVLAAAAPRQSVREVLAYAARAQGSPAPETAPPPVPVLWTARIGLGRVVVLRCDSSAEAKPGRDASAVALLVARSIEWASGRQVTIKIPNDMPLFAEHALSKDEAVFANLLKSPEAIGYFRGREIAPVMGYQGAEWLERRDREATEEPDRVVQSLGIAPGDTVADVGAGTGYFTFRLARQVGPAGKVFATDIQPEMLELLKARRDELKVANVIPVLAKEADTGLPAGAVDWILMVDVYHELAKPAPAIDALRLSLRVGSDQQKPGRLVLVEYRGEDPSVPIKPLHRTTVQQLRAALEPRGFKLVETKSFLVHQHVLIFERHDAVALESK